MKIEGAQLAALDGNCTAAVFDIPGEIPAAGVSLVNGTAVRNLWKKGDWKRYSPSPVLLCVGAALEGVNADEYVSRLTLC